MQGQPDQVVATAAMESGRVLVSWDKDFNHQRFQTARFATLNRIAFSCGDVPPDVENRLAGAAGVGGYAALDFSSRTKCLAW